MKQFLISIFIFNILFLNSQTTKQDSIQIIETTFRSLFAKNASSIKNKATFYYISIYDSLTSITVSDIIPRLGDIEPKVKDYKEFTSLTKDEQDNTKLLTFHVNSINISADGKKATLGCGYYEACLSASGNIASFTRKKGKWKLTKNEIWWIS